MPSRQEELMGGMHHFLPAEVPDVDGNLFFPGEGASPIIDLDAFGGLFAFVEFALRQGFHQ